VPSPGAKQNIFVSFFKFACFNFAPSKGENTMTSRQAKVHKRALEIRQRHALAEGEAVDVLQEAQETKLYLAFGLTSVFRYAVEILGFSEALAYSMINVARKAKEFPELRRAVAQRKLSVSKAARIASTLKPQNVAELVEFATKHSTREIEREIERINPRNAGRNSVRQLSDEFVEITITIPRKTHEKMKRAENIHGTCPAETLERVYEEHLDRHDAVRKAKRNKQELCSSRVGNLNAAETHAVNARDEGRCTSLDTQGKRCPNERWTETHHIIPRAAGGSNHLSNLTTLCRTHHQALHACLASRTGVIKINAHNRTKIWGRVPRESGAHSRGRECDR
jgi:hypothetical protein